MKHETLLDIPKNKRNGHFTWEDFTRDKHSSGAVAIAAKLISEGKTVSFDCYKRIKDPNGFLTVKREFVAIHYFGILDLKEDIPGRSIAVRISNCSNLDAVGSHSLIASWTPKETTIDPVYIAAELMLFLSRYGDVFINPMEELEPLDGAYAD